MSQAIAPRIILDLLALFGLFVLPWELSSVIMLALSIWYNRYYEACIFGFIMDSLFNTHTGITFAHYPATTIAACVLVTCIIIKKVLKEYFR